MQSHQQMEIKGLGWTELGCPGDVLLRQRILLCSEPFSSLLSHRDLPCSLCLSQWAPGWVSIHGTSPSRQWLSGGITAGCTEGHTPARRRMPLFVY